jgi:hypothetical protein
MLRALPLVALVVAAPALAAPRVEDIRLVQNDGAVDVVVSASEPLTFQSFTRTAPPAVVVDLLDVEGAPHKVAGRGAVTAVEVTRHDTRGSKLTRLSLPLADAQDYDVAAHGNTLTISVFPVGSRSARTMSNVDVVAPKSPVRLASAAPAAIVEGTMGRATATDAVLLAQAGPGGVRQMTYIGFKNGPAQSRVFARLNDTAEFSVKKEGDNLIVLEIKNATIPLRNNRNHLDTTFFDSPVKMITPSEVEDATPTIRIAIEMKGAVPYETKVEGRDIAIYFKK